MLKRVKIKGYKSLENVEIHLQQLSVFFGQNASGKSNFLELLQLLSRIPTSNTIKEIFAPPYRGRIQEAFTFGTGGLQALLSQEQVSFTIEAEVEFSSALVNSVNKQIEAIIQARSATRNVNQVAWNAFEQSTLLEGNHLQFSIEIGFKPRQGRVFIMREYFAVIDSDNMSAAKRFLEHNGKLLMLNGTSIAFPDGEERSILSVPFYTAFYPYLEALRQELASWLFYYLEPLDHMRLPSSVKEVQHIGLKGEELDAFLNTLRNLDRQQFDAVEKALHLFLPSFTGIDVNVNQFGDIDLYLMQGQTPVSERVISDGTLRILGLLSLASIKESVGLIAIEEPENGINAHSLDLVALLLETRATEETQVIATTHSPALVDHISEQSLYMFQQHEQKTSIEYLSGWKAKHYRPGLVPSIDEDTPLSERILRGDFNAQSV